MSVETNPSKSNNMKYTYGDMLATLQALTPEQLTQEVFGWDEEQSYESIKLTVLSEEHISIGGENFQPVSDLQDAIKEGDITPEELADAAVLPAGAVVLEIQS